MNNKHLFSALCAAACLAAAGAASAQQWPSKPVTILFGTAAGGPNDNLSRIIALHWEKKFGQKVLVENRPGASSTVAAGVVARAPGDGYTLVNGAFPPVGIFVKELSYDPFKDLAPISIIAQQAYYLLVSPKMNVKTLKEFVAQAKAKPGTVSIGVVTAGPHEIESNALVEALGIQANLIGYRGLATVYPALMSGELNATLGATPPQLKTGEIIGIAMGSTKRNPSYPEIPTFIDGGFNYTPRAIFPFFAPGTTPKDLQNRISQEVAEVVKSADFAERFTKTFNIEGVGSTPDETAKILKQDYDVQKRIADRVGIKPQ
jgi:tripartite-type tricarboxylate transporter receptor subunit TctC